MQINIAICDDNRTALLRIKNRIIDMSKKWNVLPEIFTYDNGKNAMDRICNKKDVYDILFLDIDMPNLSGLDVAKQIRKSKVDIILIFISAHDQYVFEAIEHNPFRYIRKERIEQELPLALKAAYSCIEQNRDQFIVVRTEDGEVKIKQLDIMYYETEKRKIRVYMKDGSSFLVWKTVKGFQQELSDKNFVKIHSGCVVNVKFIDEFSAFDITLDNGEHLIASRTGMRQLKTTMLSYWGGKI